MIRKKFAMWKIVAMVLSLVFFVFIIGCQSATQPSDESQTGKEAADEVIELRLTHINSSIHPTHIALEKFSEEVYNRTNGKVKIVLFPSDTLNPPMETYNAVKTGLADIGRAPVGYSAAVMPLNSYLVTLDGGSKRYRSG